MFWRRRRGNSYLMNDEFNGNLPAGSVIGTKSDSGHTRMVTDTENKLFISSGNEVISGGKAAPAWGDPASWLPVAITRAAGRLVKFRFQVVDATQSFEVGLDTAQAGALSECCIRNAADVLYPYISGAAGPAIGILADATWYELWIALRAAGFLVFLRGGVWATPILLYVSPTGATASLAAAITSYNAATYRDYVRVLNPLWLPAPLVSDGFSIAGVTDGAGHAEGVTGGIGSGGSGKTWLSGAATWSVAAGKAVNTPVGGAEKVTNGDMELDASWANVGTPPTNERSNVQAHAGTYSRHCIQDATFEGIRSVAHASVTGVWYQVGVWLYALLIISANTGISIFRGSDSALLAYRYLAGVPATTWTQVLLTCRETAGGAGAYMNIISQATPTEWYADDATVKPLTLSELFDTIDTGIIAVNCAAGIVITSGTQAGVVVCLDNKDTPANFIIGYHNGTNAILEKCTAGTYTTLISAAATYVANARIEVQIDEQITPGSLVVRLFYNNALVGTPQTITPALTGTRHGKFSTYSGNTIDNLVVYRRHGYTVPEA